MKENQHEQRTVILVVGEMARNGDVCRLLEEQVQKLIGEENVQFIMVPEAAVTVEGGSVERQGPGFPEDFIETLREGFANKRNT